MAKPRGLFFVAQDPVHVVVRSEIAALHDTAGRQIAPKQRRLYAKFERGIPYKWALDAAKGAFVPKSMPNVPEERWFAFYSVAEAQKVMGWNDDEAALIEERLLQTPGVLQVEPTKLEPPYPGYDNFKGSPKALAEKLVEDGYDLEHAINYENENKARTSYISAFTEKQGEPAIVEAEAEVVA